MRCYFCKKEAVGSRGGLTYHHGLCRKHFDRGHDWFFEQLDKLEEDDEDDDDDITLAGIIKWMGSKLGAEEKEKEALKRR